MNGDGWRWDVRYHPTPTHTTIAVIEPAEGERAERQADERDQARRRRAAKPPSKRPRVVPFGFARALLEAEEASDGA